MKTFRVPVFEQVKMWNICKVTVQAESVEEIMESIKEGSFLDMNGMISVYLEENLLDTAETIDWNYSEVTLSDIEEV